MAASKWEKDFRYQAVLASLELIGDDIRDDPFDYPFSFCIPISKKPISGISPGKIMIAAIVLGFICLVAAAILSSQAEDAKQANQPAAVPMTVAAVAIGFFSFACFFAPFILQRRIVSWCIGDRGEQILERAQGNEIVSCELSRADVHSLSIEGDDHILILVEGLSKLLN